MIVLFVANQWKQLVTALLDALIAITGPYLSYQTAPSGRHGWCFALHPYGKEASVEWDSKDEQFRVKS